jgi:hypothetical protein
MESVMGLDMMLYGEKSPAWGKEPVMDEGYHVKYKRIELAYWRKHPNLHSFIVNEFADGNDECQDIYLDSDDIDTIIETIENDGLPENVTGFFFGRSYHLGEADEYGSYEEQKEIDLKFFREAKNWLDKAKEMGDLRSIIYQGSW